MTKTADNGVVTLLLNDPDAMNALSPDLLRELASALTDIAGDRSARCLVITGAGRAFCAGGNVKQMASAPSAPAKSGDSGDEFEEYEATIRSLAGMTESVSGAIYRLPIPTIALLNGVVAGAGVGVACACDIRIAAASASFVTAFARVGRSSDFSSAFFFRQLMGPSRARELFFTSERIVATDALAWGLVSYVYPDGELMHYGTALADRIADGPVGIFGRMKEIFRAADSGDYQRTLALESRAQVLSGRSSEGRQALRDFVAKQARRAAEHH